jgi:tetrapyrrole methylase family protein/MazG family protein
MFDSGILFWYDAQKRKEFVQNRVPDDHFHEFVNVVRRLRKECPWDREQTHYSIREDLIEEVYEAVEAIDNDDWDELKLELGDLLLHIVLHAVMAEEEGVFTLDDVVVAVSEKMIRRHPHVFGGATVNGKEEVKRNWEHIKMSEGRHSVLEGVPKKMPALLRALRTQEKASKVGFDWKNKRDVWKKVAEELKELSGAERSRRKARIEDEFGDVLFSLVNYSRFLGINPEFALKKAIEKFAGRFRHVEHELRKNGKQIGTATLKEMDRIWDKKKRSRKR